MYCIFVCSLLLKDNTWNEWKSDNAVFITLVETMPVYACVPMGLICVAWFDIQITLSTICPVFSRSSMGCSQCAAVWLWVIWHLHLIACYFVQCTISHDVCFCVLLEAYIGFRNTNRTVRYIVQSEMLFNKDVSFKKGKLPMIYSKYMLMTLAGPSSKTWVPFVQRFQFAAEESSRRCLWALLKRRAG